MCLIAFAVQQHPDYPLVLIANRDEFHRRPSAPADFWDQGTEEKEIFAGKDLLAGGTWLGISTHGSLAAITNYREGNSDKQNALSRGQLTSDFLMQSQEALSAQEYSQKLISDFHQYNGFNLLTLDQSGLFYTSNRSKANQAPQQVSTGIHGLSNAQLNTPWPKVVRIKHALQQILSNNQNSDLHHDELLTLLKNKQQPSDSELPNTGVSLEWERTLAPIFIQSPDYGTRASTVITWSIKGEITFTETSFDSKGQEFHRALQRISTAPPSF